MFESSLILQPNTGEVMRNVSTITNERARLYIAANSFWGGKKDIPGFFRVFNPHDPTNKNTYFAHVTRNMGMKRNEHMNTGMRS